MALEATEFNVFGIRLDFDDIAGFGEALKDTYKDLEEKNPKWKQVSFCRREIGGLWDATIEMLEKLSEELEAGRTLILNPETITKYLTVDKENEDFLHIFGEQSSDLLKRVLERFDKLELAVGSIHLRLYDAIRDKFQDVTLHPMKVFKKIERESMQIRRVLQQFVEWARGRGRPIITGTLAAGLFTIGLVAGAWVGTSVPSVRLFITATVAIICTIAQAVGAIESISELSRSLGIEIK